MRHQEWKFKAIKEMCMTNIAPLYHGQLFSFSSTLCFTELEKT